MESINPLNDFSCFLDAHPCSPIPVFFVADDVSPISNPKTQKTGDVRDHTGKLIYSIHQGLVLPADEEAYDAIFIET